MRQEMEHLLHHYGADIVLQGHVHSCTPYALCSQCHERAALALFQLCTLGTGNLCVVRRTCGTNAAAADRSRSVPEP